MVEICDTSRRDLDSQWIQNQLINRERKTNNIDNRNPVLTPLQIQVDRCKQISSEDEPPIDQDGLETKSILLSSHIRDNSPFSLIIAPSIVEEHQITCQRMNSQLRRNTQSISVSIERSVDQSLPVINRKVIERKARVKLYRDWIRKGVDARYTQNDQLAIHYFSEAVQIRADDFEAYFELGLTHSIKNLDLARYYFGRALIVCRKQKRVPSHCRINSFSSLDPLCDASEDPVSFTGREVELARVFCHVLQGLLLSFDVSLSSDFDTDEIDDRMRLKHRQLNSAKSEFERALQIDPNCSFALLSIGSLYEYNEQYNEAISYFNRALEAGPDHSPCVLFANIGRCYVRKDNTTLALLYYNRSIEVNKRYVEGYRQRAKLYTATGRFNKAIEDYQCILQLNPLLASVYNERGDMYYFNMDQVANALHDYYTSLRLDPKQYYAYKVLSAIYLVQATQDLLPSTPVGINSTHSSKVERDEDENDVAQQEKNLSDDYQSEEEVFEYVDDAIIFLDDKVEWELEPGSYGTTRLTEDYESVYMRRLFSMSKRETYMEAMHLLNQGIRWCVDTNGLSELYEMRSQVRSATIQEMSEKEQAAIRSKVKHDLRAARLWPESSTYNNVKNLIHRSSLLQIFTDIMITCKTP